MNEMLTGIEQLDVNELLQLQQLQGFEQMALIALGVSIAIGLAICLFGLKLIRVLTAVTGFVTGAVIGAVVSAVAGLSGILPLIIVLVCAIAGAVLMAIFYKVGMFLWVFAFGTTVSAAIIGPDSLVPALICLGIGLLMAIITMFLWEPFVIITTSVYGGVTGGASIALLAGMYTDLGWIMLVACIVLPILGMMVQFMTRSRELGRKEKVYSEEFREKASRETEVEKARRLLEEELESGEELDSDEEKLDTDADSQDEEIEFVDIEEVELQEEPEYFDEEDDSEEEPEYFDEEDEDLEEPEYFDEEDDSEEEPEYFDEEDASDAEIEYFDEDDEEI